MFSQKKITGSCQTEARLRASWNAPCAAAPSPKNATTTLSFLAQLSRHRGTVGDRKPGGHDAVRAEDAQPGVGDVHGPAATSVGSLVLGHQLGEHAQRVQALGQAVAVAAVRRGDHVVAPQGPARPDGGRLLADGEVHEAGDQTVAVEVGHALLEPADEQHLALHLDQVVAGHRGLRSLHVRVLY